MSSTGVNREAGQPLESWSHIEQSIGVILTTPIGSRVMRREFGSELFNLIDRPMTDQVILAIYVAAATAIARWEPRFRVTSFKLRAADAGGIAAMEIYGREYPRGHLGDFSTWSDRSFTTVFGANR